MTMKVHMSAKLAVVYTSICVAMPFLNVTCYLLKRLFVTLRREQG